MPQPLEFFLDHTYLGVSGLHWLIALAVVLGGTPLLILTRVLVTARLRRLAVRTHTDLDDLVVTLVAQTRGWFFALATTRIATLTLPLPDRWDDRAQTALIVGGMIQGGLWAATLIRYLVDRRFAQHVSPNQAQVTPIAQTMLRFVGLVLVWSVVLLAALSAFGVDITALVAGLGVGGIAVALAVQRVLGDILASISIVVDKPFEPGDFITVDGSSGTVRRIGIRSTVLASLGGEELVIANNDMLSNQIQNYTRMTERRVVFKLGVVYDTSQARLEALPAMIRAIVEAREKVRFGRAVLTGLGDSAIEYEVVYNVLDPSYDIYAEIHQQILFEMIRQMRAAGYDFAFPTRTLYVIPPEPPIDGTNGTHDTNEQINDQSSAA
ncbi:MAG: mechanosensitive ion channel family protein [Nannocystis sp.]|nr:mechanosensitive ion channel family protein [Nannocystis sp.]MBA3547494.1 mechanosensitive ion channel family protein [Nannocystis sp.]